MKYTFRIQYADGTFLNAGTGEDSWFSLENARSKVNREAGQMIIESDGMDILWEAF